MNTQSYSTVSRKANGVGIIKAVEMPNGNFTVHFPAGAIFDTMIVEPEVMDKLIQLANCDPDVNDFSIHYLNGHVTLAVERQK